MSSAQLSRGRGHWDREQPTVGLRRSPRSAAATPAEHHPASDGSAGLAPTPVVVATTARALPVAAAVRVALPHVVVPSEHAPNGLPHDASSEAWCSVDCGTERPRRHPLHAPPLRARGQWAIPTPHGSSDGSLVACVPVPRHDRSAALVGPCPRCGMSHARAVTSS
jgi:hypothetical protein